MQTQTLLPYCVGTVCLKMNMQHISLRLSNVDEFMFERHGMNYEYSKK